MKIWASMDGIIHEIAEVPENWVRKFAVRHPEHMRKFGDARNSRTVYRVEAVLNAIEDGECFADAVARGIGEKAAKGDAAKNGREPNDEGGEE